MFKELVEKSIFILREARAQLKNPCVLWSTGKDSTTVLSLIRESFMGIIPWPVIHLDTGYKFPEIYEFRDKIANEWGFHLIVAKPEADVRFEDGRLRCCTVRKTELLKKVVGENRFDSVVVSIRRDEHGIRGKERYMSPRDDEFKWKTVQLQVKPMGDSGLEALQDAELSGWGLFESDFGDKCNHIRVHPILHWTELDIWRYTQERKLPFNPLYNARYVHEAYGLIDKRYRSLGCKPCTLPINSTASTIDEIVDELSRTIGDERRGRAQDKEEAYAMQRLRSLGYM